MSWQPGQPVITAQDVADWQAWKHESKLEGQRWRRAHNRRIDYYPSKEAQVVIDARTRPFVGGDYSSVINDLIAKAADLPE